MIASCCQSSMQAPRTSLQPASMQGLTGTLSCIIHESFISLVIGQVGQSYLSSRASREVLCFVALRNAKWSRKGRNTPLPTTWSYGAESRCLQLRPGGCDAATSAILIWFIHSKDALLSTARRKSRESFSPLSLMFSSFYISPDRAPTRCSVRRVQFLVLDRWHSETRVLVGSEMLLCVLLVQGASKSSRLPWPQC